MANAQSLNKLAFSELFMPTPPRAFQSATVVQLAEYQRAEKVEHVPYGDAHGSARDVAQRLQRCAKPVQLKNHLEFQASIEIDDLPWLHAQFSTSVRNNLVMSVRQILEKEFGHLRVYRYRRLFVVRHRSVESLIAGLLRAQFNTHQLGLPQINTFGDTVDQKGVSITWGVGRNGVEAESERLKRRRQKNYRH